MYIQTALNLMCVFSYLQLTTATRTESSLKIQAVFAIVSKYVEPDGMAVVVGHQKNENGAYVSSDFL